MYLIPDLYSLSRMSAMSDEPLAPSFGAELRELKGEVFAPWELVKYALNQTKMAKIFFFTSGGASVSLLTLCLLLDLLSLRSSPTERPAFIKRQSGNTRFNVA